jgi:membrane protein implicated in regulation of membrane protease activity
MTAACAWRLRRRRAAPVPTPGMVATLGLAVALFVAGLVSTLPLGTRGENFWMVAAVWLPVAALLAVVARVYVTQKRSPKAGPGEVRAG